jgi:hypothetical protein
MSMPTFCIGVVNREGDDEGDGWGDVVGEDPAPLLLLGATLKSREMTCPGRAR